MYTVKILDQDRPIALKMLAAREYKKLTGCNLLSPTHRLTDIFGDGKEKEASPDLMIALLYSMLLNGDSKFEFTVDDVARAINLSDMDLARTMTKCYIEEMTGRAYDLSENGKNSKAPQTESSGA